MKYRKKSEKENDNDDDIDVDVGVCQSTSDLVQEEQAISNH